MWRQWTIPVKAIYIIAFAALLFPVLALPYFHTGDGAAHLYCARILRSLLHTSVYNEFFSINLSAVPNSTVQVILALLTSFFPAEVAEKILVSSIIILLCISYILLAGVLSGKKGLPAMIFLLVFCYPLKMGFYGFLLGTALMMFTLSFYFSNVEKKRSFFISIALLMLVTWFTHLFAAAALMFLIFINEALFILRKEQRTNKYYFSWLLSILPVILLTVIFSSSSKEFSPVRDINPGILYQWLINLNVFEFAGNDIELYIKKILYLVLYAGIMAAMYQVLKPKKENADIQYTQPSTHYFSLLLTVIAVFLLMYRFLPANIFSGGSLNLRFLYYLLIFAGLLADSAFNAHWINILKLAVVTIAVIFLSRNAYIYLKPYSDRIAGLREMNECLPARSLIIPLNYSDEVMEYNILLRLATDNDIIIADNAEAATPNSLVKWKKEVKYGNASYLHSNRPFFIGNNLSLYPGVYLLRWKWDAAYSDSSTVITNEVIRNNFTLNCRSKDGLAEVFIQK